MEALKRQVIGHGFVAPPRAGQHRWGRTEPRWPEVCDLLLKLLPDERTADIPYWQNLRSIELSPIMGVHLWFDRPIECPPALAMRTMDEEWAQREYRLCETPATWSA